VTDKLLALGKALGKRKEECLSVPIIHISREQNCSKERYEKIYFYDTPSSGLNKNNKIMMNNSTGSNNHLRPIDLCRSMII